MKISINFLFLMLTLFSFKAHADKLPYNSKFPRAAYPYAQRQDGCSSWDVKLPELVRNDWGILGNFTSSCNAHDRCYYTLGTTARQCNEEFRDNLHKVCKDVQFALRDVCRNIANKYELFVAEFADEVFGAAQDLQHQYIEYARSVINNLYVFYAGENLSESWIDFYLEFLMSSDIPAIKKDMIAKFGKQIVVHQFEVNAGFSLPDDRLSDYIALLESFGFKELWPRIVTKDYQMIIDAHVKSITGSIQKNDEIMYALQSTFVASRDTAKLDELIRSYYLDRPENDDEGGSIKPAHPECDASKLSSWEYLDCISR
jgi:hypothetical protein